MVQKKKVKIDSLKKEPDVIVPSVSIVNSTTLVELFKFLYKNKVVITLLVLLSISISSYYYLENKYLQEKNGILIQENLKLLETTKALKESIRIFEKELQDTSRQFQEDLKDADKLTITEKRNKILYLLKRLQDLRSKVKATS
jgi:hypothetical protein